MTSKTRAKGNKTVRRTREYLENLGWTTEVVEKTGKFVKEKDLFGIGDVLAIRKGEIIFVQCKTNRPANKKLMQNFCDTHLLNSSCFTWYDRKGFLIQNYLPGKKSPIRTDLRRKKKK